MKKHLFFTLLFLLSFYIKTNAQIAIIPKPNGIKYNDGKFSYTKGLDIKIIRGDDVTKRLQKQLSDFVKGKNITVVPFSATSLNLNLLQTNTTDIPADGYTLVVSPATVSISSSGNAGLFYGMQSLMQLIKTDSSKSLPCLEIKDIPAFSYRGMHLDVVHHFFGVEIVKQYLDAMAKLKLNQFYWQIADEGKWRIELKNNTLLTDKESFYTQEQVKEVIKYAQERFINIIPGISLPMATEDSSLQKNILEEVVALFPSTYIHFGNSIIQTETEQYLTAKNKKIIGTDNIFSAKEVIMSYKSSKSGWSIAAKGNDVIMAPRQSCSLDYYQDWDDEKKSFSMTFLPLDKAYTFNPIGKIKDSKTQQHILGGQAYVSTEFIKNMDELQYMVFPRIVAFAECVWTKNANKNFNDFVTRLYIQKNYFFKEKEMPKIDLVRIKPKKEN